MSPSTHVPLKTLNLIFARLELQVGRVVGRTRLLKSVAMDDPESGYHEIIPDAFSSLDEARNSMDHLWIVIFRSLSPISWDGYEQKITQEVLMSINMTMSRSAMRLKQWSKAFETFLRRKRLDLEESSQICIHTLRMQVLMAHIHMNIDYLAADYDEGVWTPFAQEFGMMISHAMFVIKLTNNNSLSGRPKPRFSIDDGIIHPLYHAATKCRRRSIRHKALSILKAIPLQEGILNSMLAARVAERVVTIEEEGLEDVSCYNEIPNSSCVAGVEVNFEPNFKRASVKFHMWRGRGGDERRQIEECIEW
jgi:hypothetical protein